MTQKTPKVAFAPPGIDPTDQEYPLEGPTVTGCFGKLLQFGVWGMALYGFIMMAQANFGGASAAASTPIPPTPEPQIVIVSSTPEPSPTPTETAIPSATPTGTWTPEPSPTPTQTAIPSETPIPSATLVPAGVLATWTPGAWMLTRHAATIEALRPTATYTRTPTPATKG
jgi:hypothetical protein